MTDSQVEEIKSKIDIVNIIGEHVQLTKTGSNFRGLCPFHQEKTPSFMVSQDLQIYKCFGCSESGDVFTFLEKYEGMDFKEALVYLAEKAGVTLTSFNSDAGSEKQISYEINSLAAKFYNYLLVSHPIGKVALNYLQEERRITIDSIKTFNIGYAPANTNSLSDFLIKKKKFKVKDIEKAGLIFVSKSSRIYDRFEGRIIFPISDHRGNSIALAGRLLPPGKANVGKYINSPETPVYHKSSSLYGISITKDYIKKEGFAVVVEGELDLISSFQIGIKNIVAIKGSAFTQSQASLLSRYTKEVVLALDSDLAGLNASRRGIKILQDEGFEIKVVKLGKFKDPDEAAKANPEFLLNEIKNSVPVWDFIIDAIVGKFDADSASGKEKISKELTPILADIDNKILQDHYVRKLAKLLEVNESAVLEEVEKSAPKSQYANPQQDVKQTDIKPKGELMEEMLIGLILKTNPILLKNPKIVKIIKTPFAKRILEEFGNFAKSSKEPTLSEFAKSLPKELLERFSITIFEINEIEEKEIKNEINKLFASLSSQSIKQDLAKAANSKDYAKLQKEMKDFNSDKFERIIS